MIAFRCFSLCRAGSGNILLWIRLSFSFWHNTINIHTFGVVCYNRAKTRFRPLRNIYTKRVQWNTWCSHSLGCVFFFAAETDLWRGPSLSHLNLSLPVPCLKLMPESNICSLLISISISKAKKPKSQVGDLLLLHKDITSLHMSNGLYLNVQSTILNTCQHHKGQTNRRGTVQSLCIIENIETGKKRISIFAHSPVLLKNVSVPKPHSALA